MNYKSFNYSSDDRIIERLLGPYKKYFSFKDFLEGEENISKIIKELPIKEFLNLQKIILKQKTFITEGGKTRPYIKETEIIDYLNYLEYEKEHIGRFTKIYNSFNYIYQLTAHFIELESSLFAELIDSSSLLESFIEENSSLIINFYNENNISPDGRSILNNFKTKASQFISSFESKWETYTVKELIDLKKSSYNLLNFDLYISS